MQIYTLEEYAKLKKKKNELNNVSTLENNSKQKKLGNKEIISLEENAKRKNKEVDLSDIAPVKTMAGDDKKIDFFTKGAFEDGYQFGDVTKTILGTAGELGVGLVKGGASLVEGLTDVARYGIAGISGNGEYTDKLKSKANANTTESLFEGADVYLNKYSVLGKTSESILQGVGQVGALAGAVALAPVTVGTAGATALSTAILGLSSIGSGMSEAYQGGATDKEATVYGISKGVIDAVTESLFGMVGKVAKVSGLSKGITGLDDAFAMKLSSKISNQVAKNWVKFGVKSSAEGVEEFLSGLGGAVAKYLTYMDEKELGEIVKDEKLLEQFVVGTVTSGMIQSGYIPKTAEGSLKEANKTGRDLITGYTQNEQAVIDKEIERRVGDKNLSKKELGKIEEQVKKDIERGYIGIETIENALGGKTLEEYNDLKAESDEFNTLYTKEEGMSEQQRDRLAELKEKNLKTPYETALKDLQTRMSQEVREATKNDTFLVESYNEKARKSQKFEADITKYSEKERPVVQKIVDSGLVNNTRRTHDFVDFLVKVSADKGIPIEISNILKLKEARIEIADANGFVDNDKLVVNIDSSRAFDTIVGHEVTHTLKTSGELYDALKETLFDIAKSKGEFNKRYSSLEKLYEGRFKGTPEEIKQKLEEELVADLVGDYIFSDTDFVRSLSVEKPNVFKKIYNEIKYLIKVATAGSNERRKLEKAKKIFDEMYKEDTNMGEGTRYSLSSMGNTFFENPDMTAEEFEKQDYKNTDGYKNYVEQCLNNYKQSRSDFNEEVARKEIEDSIEGIVKVALASKRAGYDIYDDGNKRDVKDSKNRLLFSSLEPNSDYFTSSDISTICDKRQNFADIYDDIVRAEESKGVPNEKRFFSNVDNYFYLHKVMADKGLTQPCRQCYVESMRKNLSPMANAFLRLVNEADANNLANDQLYQQKGKDKGTLKTSNATIRERVRELLSEYDGELTVETLTTEDGLAQLKIQAPLIYEAFNSFYGQSKPKMPKSATPFRFGELTALLTDDNGKINQRLVKRINDTGGFRLQSYSDFQIQNYTDVLQVIFEAGTIGLNGHAYTKVPAFLDATEGTNLKRNISIFMYKDGNEWKIDRNDSFPYSLEEIYEIVNSDESGNTSIIVVSQNEDNSAWIMANDNVGYGIPFHKSGLKMGVVRDTIVKEDGREIRGYKGAKDHTKQQTEVWKNSARKEDGSLDHKALTKVKKGINIYEFWDFNNEGNLTKNELIEKNVKRYIDECERLGYLPKFREYVMNNAKVLNNVLEYAKELGHVSQDATIDDISFNYKGYQIPYGYYKFLGDFGMFKPNGEASPQAPLSLSNYDFDKAVDFFSNSEELRRNEILQQFANGEERQRYRESGMSAEELLTVIKQKRREVVNEIAPIGKEDIDYEMEELLEEIDWSELLGTSWIDNLGYKIDDSNTTEVKSDAPRYKEDTTAKGKVAKITNERIERLFNEYGASNPSYAQAYITSIHPRDFLSLTLKDSVLEKWDNASKEGNDAELYPLNEDKLRNQKQTPFLEVDTETGVVRGHEGRHRMRALLEAGVTEVPVVIIDTKTKYSKQKENAMTISAQDFNDGAVNNNFTTEIRNLIPINEVYRDDILTAYGGNGDIKYSLSKQNDIAPVGNYFRDDIALETSEANTEIPTNREGIAPVVTKNTIANYEPAEEERIAGEDLSKKNADKIRTLKAEIQGSRVTKDITKKEFDDKIAKKQAEYDSLIRKDTKKAVDLRNQITNLETRRDSLLKSLDNKIERANNRIESIERESRFDKRRTKMQQYRELFSRLIGDTSTWKDKKYGFQYQTNTLHRNLRDIVRDENGNPDIVKADAIYDELQGSVNRNEAQKNREANRVKNVFREMKINNTESVYIQMLGELRHNPDTTLTQETVDEYYNANKGKIDTQKVDKAIEEARKLYDDLYERVNEVLREHGFKEIGYRKGYFPHFTDQKQSLLAKILNWKVNKDEIPTDIAGLTEFFEPQRTWQSFDKHRTSDVTDYNFLKGLDSYVDGSLDWIYHIGDIQKHRAFETELRYRHSSEQVQKKIDEYRNNPMLSVEEVEELIEGLTKEARNPLGNFVTDLNTRTNILAGKKSSKDRNMEATFNRHAYSVMTNINNRVTANQVVGSVSSALTNFIPITQSWGQVSPTSSLIGMKQTIQSAYRDDGMIAKSDFLTNRLAQNEALYKDFWDKAGNKVGGLMEIADSFTSQTVWRSKYYENIKNGMSEAQAIKDADQFAENVIAGRSKGNMPTIFHAKNPVTKMLTAFQLEVANQYGYMFKDMPQDMANESIAKLVKGYASMFVGAYVYNALYSSLTGRDSAFDVIGILQEFIGDLMDDEEENNIAGATVGLVNNALEEVPFIGGLLGGGRVPISSALPYDGKIQDFFDDVEAGDKKSMLDEATNLLYYGLAPMGGGQLRKTIQGASMFRDDLPVSGSYTKSGNLRFPVEETFLNVLQGHVFGQYANKNAREYFDRELAPLNKNQIQEYKELDIPISDYWDYLEGKKGLSKNEELTEYIVSLDLPISKQNILVNNVLDRKEKVDLTGYEDYSGYEEFNFAIKNPEKYAISKAVGGYKSYDSYMDKINSFKGDGKKEDVRDYIFSLNIDHGQKAILYRSMYCSKDDKNEFDNYIVNYLNSRNDLSDEEKRAILNGLK